MLLAVDDDRDVVRAVERDLRSHYARDFTVLSAGSGAEGLELLGRLTVRGDSVALLLTDQRMPQMTGVEFLAQAADIAPAADASSSPPTRTPKWPFARSTRSASITT